MPSRTTSARPFSARLLAAVATLLLVLGGLLAVGSPAEAAGGRPWPGHPDRRLVPYRVQPGDTAARIATRFHAWTAELRGVNGKSPRSTWYAGERVTVPVVVSRARADRTSTSAQRPRRTEVRRVVVRTAKRHGVPVDLALAVAWHESGWQQQVRSPVGAIGTMQVMPGNRVWLSSLTGQDLRLRDLQDNVTAGVVLLKLLRTVYDGRLRGTLAGYYQGQGSVEENGLYESTKQYIANVRAVKQRLGQGWRPDR